MPFYEEAEGWPLAENRDDWDSDDWEWYSSLGEPELEDEYPSEYLDESVEYPDEPDPPDDDKPFHGQQRMGGQGRTVTIAESDWHYDDSGYYAYITLNGPEQAVGHLMDVLSERGYTCPTWGPSFRPANNGRRYDWYIRIWGQNGSKPARDELLSALGPVVRKSVTPTYQDVELLQRKLTRLEAANKELTGQVERLETEALSLRQELHDARTRRSEVDREKKVLQSKVERLEEEIKDRWDQVKWYSGQLHRIQTDREQESALRLELDLLRQRDQTQSERLRDVSNELADLIAEKKEWEREQQTYDTLLRQQDDEIRDLKNDLAIVTAERDELMDTTSSLSQTVEEEEEQGRYSGDLQPKTLALLLSITLPNIEFLNGSLDFIGRELPDPRRCLNELYRIHAADSHTLRSKRVESTRTWLERRFSTGQDDSGRIYYRRVQGGTVEVLVSEKGSQNRDIQRLCARE
ncbi:MAG: hypothetical protein ACOYEP_06965 [Limnochordia bacterium]